VVASARIWAGLLDRYREGQALALLNGLLGLATLIPVITAQLWALLLSGLLFGGVFLSVVASTTAWVRHNLPQTQWSQGITVFTVVFAAGQVVGPTAVGSIADRSGGLVAGLLASACVLWAGSAVALMQKPMR
jgi:MFS family permease